MKEFYNSVYSNDNPAGDASGWIQWKGTDVCIDIHCSCGHPSHFDGWFLYFLECPKCNQKYAVGQNIKLISLTEEQITHVEELSVFKTCELEEE